MARKTTPRPPAQAVAKPLTYQERKAAAVEIMGGRAGTVPERE
jgi:hypothetical protein